MNHPEIVDRETWLKHRLELLLREKKHARDVDELARLRRQLPWVRIDEPYRFAGAAGVLTLADLFGEHRQLLIYHFMFGPDWDAGCPTCSFWADNFDGIDVHLAARDIRFAVVSRASLDRLLAYRERMGWRFDWFSAAGSDFNFDFGVSFEKPDGDAGKVVYNYRETDYFIDELPGISVFARGDDGAVYHTYSTYARGVEAINGAYRAMDLTPFGRAERADATQSWVRRRDEYGRAGGRHSTQASSSGAARPRSRRMRMNSACASPRSTRGPRPSSSQGTLVAARSAASASIPTRSTSTRSAVARSRSAPASVPSSSRRQPSARTIRRLCSPNSRKPVPATAIASLTRKIRPGGRLAAQAMRMTSGCTWMPSAISPAETSPQDNAMPTSPGARLPSGLIALNRWVTQRAPARTYSSPVR